MDMVCLKKKLSTFLTAKGYFRNVGEDVLYEVLKAWEEWPGTAKEFYKAVGYSQRKMAGLIGKAKRLKREGFFGNEDFAELSVEVSPNTALQGNALIELDCKNGKIIRFPRVDQLLEYLKKTA